MDKWDLVLLWVLCVLCVSVIVAMSWWNDETKQCLSNPLQYGVDKVALASQKEVYCTCGAANTKPTFIQSNVSLP